MYSIDLIFSLHGSRIPAEHSYVLYAAISRVLPELHQAPNMGIFPIQARSDGAGGLILDDRSHLRIRLPQEMIREALPLTGKMLEIAGSRLRVGVPRVAPLVPSSALSSRLVIISPARAPGELKRPAIMPDWFTRSALKKLKEMGIASATASIPLITQGPRAGEPRRLVIRIKGQTYAGYPLVVEGLTAEESILLQENGLGGRRLMGCGLFLPVRGE